MNPAQLLQHFDRLADAPDAVPRLRKFILDLAVRGKLVEQDPNDEPASELLKRIRAERGKLVTNAKRRTNTDFTLIDENVPNSLPSTWSWVKFDEVASIESNLVKPDGFPNYPHIAPDNIERHTGRLLPYETIRESKVFSAKHRFFPGHIVYSKIRPALGKAALVDFEGLCSADMYPILSFIDRVYLLKFMLSEAFIKQSVKEDTRVAMPKINQEALSKILVALPPLAEQHRIVAKVDELMGLCDRLEKGQAEREVRRERLVRASWQGLSQPADAETFRTNARFALDQLPHLTTRPEHIPQLRQTILNLAVRGKLVPQDPNDEPASELLRCVQVEKEGMIKNGKIRKHNPLPPIELNLVSYSLPEGWTWARYPELGEFCRGKSRHRPRNDPKLYEGGNYKLVQTGDVARANGVIESFTGLYNDIGLAHSRLWPKGTMCITIAANIADSAILGFDACIPDSVVGFIPFSKFDNARYFEYFMRTAKAHLVEFAPSTAQKNINIGILEMVLIPLPPLPEQNRIVAKVDELMALCDRLETQLTTTQTESRRLLDAVLHESLSPA